MTPDPCQGCDEVPSYLSKRCAKCAYKFASLPREVQIETTVQKLAASRIYKVARSIGLTLTVGGSVVAVMGDIPIATYLLLAGIATYITGTVAAWWNEE